MTNFYCSHYTEDNIRLTEINENTKIGSLDCVRLVVYRVSSWFVSPYYRLQFNPALLNLRIIIITGILV